jgi:hypothetical protein
VEARAVTKDDFRKIALTLPGAIESAHMGHPDFRVGGKIFATLMPEDGWGMVKLTPDEQEAFVQSAPRVFSPVPGGWGRQGATRVRLETATKAIARDGLTAAWRIRAPKPLLQEFDGDGRRNRARTRDRK